MESVAVPLERVRAPAGDRMTLADGDVQAILERVRTRWPTRPIRGGASVSKGTLYFEFKVRYSESK